MLGLCPSSEPRMANEPQAELRNAVAHELPLRRITKFAGDVQLYISVSPLVKWIN